MKIIFKSSFILASIISIFEASSALAFVEAPPNNPNGQIRFSATEVGSNKLAPAFTDSVFPNELLTPGKLYPEMTPVKQSQYKEGPLDLSDDYSSQYGKANITEVKYTFPYLAGLGWRGSGKFVDDTADDGYALRNSSYARGSWATEETGPYLDLVWFNVNGGLKPHIIGDAWVVGSFKGSFGGKNPSTPFEILFGFDGANQGREDFLSYNFGGTFGNTNGGLAASGFDYNDGVSASADFGVDTFDVKLLAFSTLFGLNAGDIVNIEGTFTCAALNGYCGGRPTDIPPEWDDRIPEGKRIGQGVQEDVPGPLPILGLGAMFGYSRKLRKRIKSSKPEVISTTAQ